MSLRITTWNVNGIRNPFGYHPWSSEKTFQYMFDTLEADIVCLQETKIQRKDLTDEMVLVPGWDSYFTFPKHKKGYSGVAVYTRNSKCCPIRAEEGITGILEPPAQPGRAYKLLLPEESIGGYPDFDSSHALSMDSEGRALVLDFGAFVLINTYCPASTAASRDGYRVAFVEALFSRVRNLVVDCKRRVVVVGDLNISRDEIDFTGAKEAMKELGISDWKEKPTTHELDKLLEPHPDGVMMDLCREYFPDRRGMFTCWDVKKNKRPGNAGARIDYILCSSNMKNWFMEANIQEGLMGSDHCPVFGVIKQTVEVDGKSKHILDLVNPTGTFRHGVLQKTIPYPPKPRLCMKRFSEFQNRQSIKDMFRKAPQKPPNPPLDNQSKSLQSNWSAPSSESPVKKLKISSTAQKPRSQPSNQKNLRAFFKCASDTVSCSKVDDSQLSASLIHQTGEISATSVAASQPAEAGEDDFVDPIESKEKWTQLFSKRPVPQCDGHGEDAIQRITKKPGPNCGRAFWMCQRPIGPAGEAAAKSGVETEWKCNFFKWASDL